MKNFMRNYSEKLQQLLCLLACVLMIAAVSIRRDGKVTTGEGPAATLPYAYKILSYFVGNEAVAELQKGMRYTHLMSNK